MKILIAYSEYSSLALAEALCWWVPLALPFCSAELAASESGGRTVDPAESGLESIDATFVCVTPGALETNQLFFSAGSSYPLRAVGTPLTPVLLDLDPEDLANTPLAMFQAARAERTDLFTLAMTLNEQMNPPLKESQLDDYFQRAWPELEDKLASVPGGGKRRFQLTVLTKDFFNSTTFGGSDKEDDGWDTVARILDAFTIPSSPVPFPKIDYGSLDVLDVEHKAWIKPPKLLSRLRTEHVALISADAKAVWGDNPWLLAALIRERVKA